MHMKTQSITVPHHETNVAVRHQPLRNIVSSGTKCPRHWPAGVKSSASASYRTSAGSMARCSSSCSIWVSWPRCSSSCCRSTSACCAAVVHWCSSSASAPRLCCNTGQIRHICSRRKIFRSFPCLIESKMQFSFIQTYSDYSRNMSSHRDYHFHPFHIEPNKPFSQLNQDYSGQYIHPHNNLRKAVIQAMSSIQQ